MQKEIIDMLDLKKTDIIIGQSFVKNIPVYEYRDGILLAKCNSTGDFNSNGNILVTNKNFDGYAYISPEFILDIGKDAVDNYLSNFSIELR